MNENAYRELQERALKRLYSSEGSKSLRISFKSYWVKGQPAPT